MSGIFSFLSFFAFMLMFHFPCALGADLRTTFLSAKELKNTEVDIVRVLLQM